MFPKFVISYTAIYNMQIDSVTKRYVRELGLNATYFDYNYA